MRTAQSTVIKINVLIDGTDESRIKIIGIVVAEIL